MKTRKTINTTQRPKTMNNTEPTTKGVNSGTRQEFAVSLFLIRLKG